MPEVKEGKSMKKNCEIDLKRVRQKIAAERAINNITQSEMSKKLKIKTSTYRHKEHNPETFKLIEIIRLLKVLDKPFENIFLIKKENKNEKQNGKNEEKIE